MNPREADRRSGDRRRSDRRAASRAGDVDRAAGDSFFDPGWLAAGDAPPDSEFLQRQARRAAPSSDSALLRVARIYSAARAVIGIGLVGIQGMGSLFGTHGTEWLALVSLCYAVQAITFWLLPRFAQPQPQLTPLARRRRQWLATIGVDLVAFTALHTLEMGSSFNYAALLVLPVLMAGVLTPRLLALATAAGVSLMLLLVAWRGGAGHADAPALMVQSGLAGLGLFAIALLAGELAARLAREELAARGSLELARQQAQLNRLVIEEMADGVLVVDRKLRVRAANPAARALLVDQGLSPPAPFTLMQRPAWQALQRAVEGALELGVWPEAGSDVMLEFGAGHTRTLRLRVRFMRARALDAQRAGAAEVEAEPFAVLLLEDLRTLQARIRQEKLAAMGRVSAGIAHEIRNPLAAIAQANALLLEDALAPPQQRLARMVADNVARLKRLVDDVMEVAPGGEPQLRTIDAAAVVAGDVADWARTAGIELGAESRLRLELPTQPLPVVFDPEHLRRVLVNLLDNAHRHAGAEPGAIFLRLAPRDEAEALLSVFSDGAPITPEVERLLFEPFFSTRSRGSGLGLYICRELCERYGASIEYRPRPAAERLRNEFLVAMRRAATPDPS
ncbi:MAG: histidine kinase [Burkholderiales bacterium]|nr:histidine kinase [Burkholderiales bacterium]MDE1925607.1 histidine kinase [Burkholderiales bacterium]MDE2160044.1 histidine kinase [Burkholderiales bacterium]MDE2505361.1 histidine kinase [Burkholderiales bacterium]